MLTGMIDCCLAEEAARLGPPISLKTSIPWTETKLVESPVSKNCSYIFV